VSRRVVIAGISGNGKTTLGRRLAQKLGVPFTELDGLMYRPGWVSAESETFRREVEAVMDASDGWVLDGMYKAQLDDLVLRRADTLVWLDQPCRWCCRDWSGARCGTSSRREICSTATARRGVTLSSPATH